MKPPIAILFFVVLSTAFAVDLDAQSANGDLRAVEARKTWSDQTNGVWSLAGQPGTAQVKENAIRFGNSPNDSFEIPIAAVVADATGDEWVGKKTDLYLETRSGIVGISLPRSGVLIWDRGLMRSTHSTEGVDQLIKRFETQADYTQLLKTYDPVTDLRSILSADFFTPMPEQAIAMGSARITSYTLADGKLQLTMASRIKAHTASLWIDLEKRAVVKAIEDGEQIVPRYDYGGFIISPDVIERHGLFADGGDPSRTIQAYLATNGVDLGPDRSQIVYGDRRGRLVVKATPADLEKIKIVLSLPSSVPDDPATGLPVFPDIKTNWLVSPK